MIGSTRCLRVFASPVPCDLRLGFDGLYAIVRRGLGRDPCAGDYFLFVNRERNRAKVLHYDGTGLCIYHKRLERGRFAALWRDGDDTARGLELTHSELCLFLEGCREVGYLRLSPPASNDDRATKTVTA